MKIQLKNVKKITENEVMMDLNHPSLGWIPYTAIKSSGEEFMEAVWKEAVKEAKEYDVEIIKAREKSRILDKVSSDLTILTDKYSQDEKSIWADKKVEAEKVINGEKSILIEAEAAIRGIDPKELAEKIIAKNMAYKMKVVEVEATKKKIEKDFENIKTLEELQKIVKLHKRA